MKRPLLQGLVATLLALTGCAVVSSLSSGIKSVGRWADGFAFGKGEVVDGQQEGDWEFQYEDGRLRAKGKYKDDVQDGPWEYWYANGNEEWTGTFVDGKRSGTWKYWHEGGAPKAQGAFVDGREFGQWIFWSPRGTRSQIGTFLNGRRTGRWTYSNDRGQPSAEGLYLDAHESDGSLGDVAEVGLWSFWDEDGERSQAWYDYPAGVTSVLETWEDGTPRREGFLRDGRPEGLWVIRHRNGDLRMLAQFRDGSAHGHWAAYRTGETPYASGMVERGRAFGDWTVIDDQGTSVWNANGSSPAPPVRGDWSSDSLPDTAPVGEVLATWIAESRSRIPDQAILATVPPAELEPAAADVQLAKAIAKPKAPLSAQPWTARELKEYWDYVRAYEFGDVPAKLASRYAGARQRVSKKAGLASGGDSERMAALLGKPLPLTYFRTGKGEPFDVVPPRGSGRTTVLVIMRGFGGGICVYCAAQAGAICTKESLEAFRELDTDAYVVFPGSEMGLTKFVEAYEAITEEECPIEPLYEDDYKVAQRLGLEGAKVLPSTFVLDSKGIVRYAYVGKTKEDRPHVKDILDVIRGIKAEQ